MTHHATISYQHQQHQQHRPHPTALQPKNASTLAPIVVLDSSPVSPAMKSLDSGILSPLADSGSALATSDSETLPRHSLDTPGLSTSVFTPQPPIQLRVSIAVDPEQHHEKLVKARLHLVLVLTALVQLPDGRETWVEQCRTEFLSLEKGRPESHFVKSLLLQIQENFLVIGFTLLAVPPPNMSPKVLESFPALDGLLPWAETSVAIEHFVVGSGDSTHKGISNNGVRFSVPLMEISMLPDSGKRRSKHTVATLGVIVGETYPKVPPLKAIAEKRRVGPSFSQTYYGHSVRGSPLYGREHLYESPLAFALPIKLLQFLAQDEKRMLEELEKEPDTSLSDLIQAVPLDHRPNPITRGVSFMETLRRGATRPSSTNREQMAKSTKARQSGLSEEDSHLQKLLRQQISAHRNIEVYYQNMVAKMEQKLKENIDVGQGPFRRSPEKKDESVQWAPLNCCVQELLVHDDGYQTNYQTTTAGAAAAHSAGFSRSSGGSRLGKAPSFGAFWDKQEKGFDLKRDFRALQDVLDSCSGEFIALLTSSEAIDRARCLALLKEITFLNSEIVSFGTVLLQEYLTPLSTEGTARSVCCEIESLVARLKEIDLGHPSDQEQGQAHETSSRWMDRCKGLVKEVVRCTVDLRGFIDIAIQHECLMTDATLVAGADWMMEKRTRECSFSQLMATMATSFLAILEDWWANMAPVLLESNPDMKQSGFNGMDFIDEERPSEHDAPRDSTKRRSSTFRLLNGQSAKRRPSLRSTLSNTSSTSSTTGPLGRSSAKHPLEDFPRVKAHNAVFWDQLVSLGWLVQIESLLSTQGNELGMLLDYVQAVADMRESVTIGFHMLPQSPPILPTEHSSAWEAKPADAEEAEDTTVQISGRRGRITLSFGLDPLQFSLLPKPLKAGTSKIHVYPVFFSQGINEMQTLSNLTGRSPLQQSINEEGLRYMQHYVTRYQAWQSQSQEAASQGYDRAKASTYGRHTIWRGPAGLSSASLLSNLDSDWDMVSPSRAELWDGEPLVAQLLDQLERSVLGHSDETRSAPASGISAVSPPESSDVQLSYPSQSTLNALKSRTLEETESGAASGILGSMMEYGSSRLFSSKGHKNTDILECAEALTRALGQIKMPIALHKESPKFRVPTSHWTASNHGSDGVDAVFEEERPDTTEAFTLPLSSLWVTSHVVSCKSAKDRTSMSVTLSQVNILRACHGLEISNAEQRGGDWKAILDAMRSEIGVRIKNVERNLKLGEFAKDLLWISAFGSPEPQQAESAFGSTSSTRQESHPPQNMSDALTYVRSLIPNSSQPSLPTGSLIQSGIATGHGHDMVAQGSINTSQDSAILSEENVHRDSRDDDCNGDLEYSDDRILVEEESSSSDSPAQSSTLGPQLPPMKLMESSTGPALAPVVTLGDDPSQAEGGRRSPLHLSDGQNVHALPTNIPISYLPGPENHAIEGYQSFPESFDEPVLAVRLARSLGLDSLGASSTHQGSSNEPSSQTTALHSPTLPQAQVAVRMHRSTPSWSSQQSAYYQQRLTTSTAATQNPPFVKRLSALGLGLGVISKAKDGTSSGTSAPQHRHQASDEFGGSQVSGMRDALNSNSDNQCPASFGSPAPSIATETSHAILLAKRGKFAFNKYQLKFLPEAYRPPARMATGVFET